MVLPLLWLLTAATALPCGQRRAFIDLGANDGQSLTWFAKHWAPRAQSKFTAVFAFEMNPVFVPVLKALLQPWSGELVAAAAWTSDGTLVANLQLPGSRTATKGGVVYNMTSSALEVGGIPLNKKRAGAARASHETRSHVPTVDLARWLAQRFCREDAVDVKMDIEGAEFEVLEHLLRTGHANLIDVLAVEWHTEKRAKGGARAALNQRRESIIARLRREGVRLVVWRDARAGDLGS